ncbi:SGNH hydrolase-type esterase domain-containing protein [Annulohypoxylon maeteangense]|uniref:SGNH hydrolase-type esterase domain-containing protein n=1 Tax=Annulohypoxylon maeteangense TaxID=1927788 RepID=UPI002007F756|nr:SGNH hydrolase-type esterase domain-containing protein [Annulohypoxylon maeteangense]KAI0886148.1 SGNH hydrolase-type esterase domain-containing protein [Annulohypoxylon maeteangense]
MLSKKFSYLLSLTALASGTILQNGQVRITNYPDTRVDISSYEFQTYDANATELSYKGRWDSKKVSWWSAPGLVFGFTGDTVAITFRELTTDATLIGYRIGGLDWSFTNVTAGATHLLVSPKTPGVNETFPVNPLRFELRVTNWAYGVQIDKVHVASGELLIKIPPYKRSIEFIGDSLTSGMYTSYEGLSSFAYGVGAGLGDTEWYVTAYPGICVSDQDCWGNPRGQSHQWFYASDTSWRASQLWGDEPESWDFDKQETTPDIVIINLGTNDNNTENHVSTETYVDAYKKLIQGVHGKYPEAQVLVMQLWMGFHPYGNSYQQDLGYELELKDIVAYFNSDQYLSKPAIWDGTTNTTTTLDTPSKSFVHYFSTKGILQHNDIGPLWHPTDVGAIKVASHLSQFIKLTFGWDLIATGPEIFHDTLYWNDEQSY